MSEKQTVYELAYMLRIGESDAALKAILQKNGATIVKEQPAVQIQLAYPIKKQGVGLFGYVHLTLQSGDAVKQISDALELEAGVLRFLVTKVPKLKPRTITARPAETVEKKASPAAPIDRIDSLSNEKLSQTLEEILK